MVGCVDTRTYTPTRRSTQPKTTPNLRTNHHHHPNPPNKTVSDSETSTEVSGDSDEVYDLTDAQWSAKMTPMREAIEVR